MYVHNDEAGELVYTEYDFKGNLLNHYRRLINDNGIVVYQKYVVDWDNFPSSHLSNTENTITQEYDALNRIRKAFYPKGRNSQPKQIIPGYNKSGALESVFVGSTMIVRKIAYNARGQRILTAMGNDMMTRYVYDDQTFRLVRSRAEKYTQAALTYTPAGGVQQDLAYSYDLEGTVTTINDKAPNSGTPQNPNEHLREFTHDPLRRLLSATGRESSNMYDQPSWDLNLRPQDATATNTYTRSYQYDKLGNIQKLKHVADGQANQNFNRDYSYSSINNQLQSFDISSSSYANMYDANGNITKQGESRYYEWDANDKMAVYKNQAGNSTPSVYTNYFYNSQGERIKKHTRKGNRVEVTFYMDGGLFETTYVKPTGGSIDHNRFYNTLHIFSGAGDAERVAIVRQGKNVGDNTPSLSYIIADHLGNSTVLLKSDASLINKEAYYPFGETSFGSYKFKRYRYNGKEKDEESGLYEYGQRYYAPWLCRFISVDPVAEDYPQYTSYNYAGNKPVSKVDLEGLQEENAEKQGGAQTESGGNLTGEYVVKDGQGPTQIAKELKEIHGIDIDWVSVIDGPRNQQYFSSVAKDERYDKSNKEYENLNLNPGDIIYFNPADVESSPLSIDSESHSLKESVQNSEQLPEVPFDDTYEENLERQPDISQIKSQIKDNNIDKTKYEQDVISYKQNQDSVQRDIDLIYNSNLKKGSPYKAGEGMDWGPKLGETIRQSLREINRDKFKKQARIAKDSVESKIQQNKDLESIINSLKPDSVRYKYK